MLYLIQDIQHSEIHSVMSLDFDFGFLLLPESRVCAYVYFYRTECYYSDSPLPVEDMFQDPL